MDTSRLINVVIPVRDRWLLTRNCLEALRAATRGDFFEVTVVDNGSTDATPADCPALGAQLFGACFRYERFDENRNFGPACNHGATTSTAPFVFFLNNDTIPTGDWHTPLLEAFGQMPGLGAVGPLLLYPGSDRVQHLGVVVDPAYGTDHLYEYFPVTHRAVARRRSLQAITGAALFMPRFLFLEVGGFFEGYVNGFEDVDLCLALRKAGRTLTVAPESVIHHLGSQSAGRFAQEDANARLLFQRWGRAVRPDMHLHAREDGFVLRVTETFETHVALPAAREAELDRAHAGVNDPVALWKTLLDEPLWFGGYDRLAVILERGGLWQEAFEARMLQCSLGPSLGRLERYRSAAMRAGHADRAEDAARHAALYRAVLRDPQEALRLGGEIADRLHGAGEASLERAIRRAMHRAVNPTPEGPEGLGCIDPVQPGAA
ncbi:MAG: glycosyltransferase family 2 protein [Desulfovibrionaceae bacterium]|jgi:GT2 family glycosyltransferase|nr:glycosyltransferase family 2 protein [Desulfovibrionaceae bacterium]